MIYTLELVPEMKYILQPVSGRSSRISLNAKLHSVLKHL